MLGDRDTWWMELFAMITLALIGLLGGLITGVSPCVLPMLPIIFFAGTAGKTDDDGAKRLRRDRKAAVDGDVLVEDLQVGKPARGVPCWRRSPSPVRPATSAGGP